MAEKKIIETVEINGQLFIDAGELSKAGLTLLDPELRHTVMNLSGISVLDPNSNQIYYRGIPIGDIVDSSKTSIETAYLLLSGKFPNQSQLSRLKKEIAEYSIIRTEIQEGLKNIIRQFPQGSDPMSIAAAAMAYMAGVDNSLQLDTEERRETAFLKAIAITPIINGLALRRSKYGDDWLNKDREFTFPKQSDFGVDGENYSYANVFLKALRGNSHFTEEQEHNLDKLFIMHMDAGLSPSTFTAIQASSTLPGMWNCILSGMGCMSGPIHGGAGVEVMKMFNNIKSRLNVDATQEDIETEVRNYIAEQGEFKNKIPGIGHIVFNNLDPRARIMAEMASDVCNGDLLYKIAAEIDRQVESSNKFQSDKVHPNIDFYPGLIWQDMGVPENGMGTAFFTARSIGYMVHVLEAKEKKIKTTFPEQVYVANDLGRAVEDAEESEQMEPPTRIVPQNTEVTAFPRGPDVEINVR